MKRIDQFNYSTATRMVSAVFALVLAATNAFGKADLCILKNDAVTGRPTLDGAVADDVGYTNATRATLGRDLGTPYAGFVRIVEDRNDPAVWIGLEVEGIGSGNYSPRDTFLLTFSSGSGQETHIMIHPFGTGPGTPLAVDSVDEVKVWRRTFGTSDWGDPETTDPAWLTGAKRILTAVGWSLEIKIPKAASSDDDLSDGIFFEGSHPDADATGTFKLYLNVMRTSESILPEVLDATAEIAWPSDALIKDVAVLPPGELFISLTDVPIPEVAEWSNVTLGTRPQCTGVALARSDIGTRNVGLPASKMVLYHSGGSPISVSDCPPIAVHRSRRSL